MTKKRSLEIFAAKMEIFSEKRHLGRREIFPSPQTRRQVSATECNRIFRGGQMRGKKSSFFN